MKFFVIVLLLLSSISLHSKESKGFDDKNQEEEAFLNKAVSTAHAILDFMHPKNMLPRDFKKHYTKLESKYGPIIYEMLDKIKPHFLVTTGMLKIKKGGMECKYDKGEKLLIQRIENETIVGSKCEKKKLTLFFPNATESCQRAEQEIIINCNRFNQRSVSSTGIKTFDILNKDENRRFHVINKIGFPYENLNKQNRKEKTLLLNKNKNALGEVIDEVMLDFYEE